MATELAKVYDPKSVEKEVYGWWTQTGAFDAQPGSGGAKYCIVIPPPNVTAALHLGHALNNTLQDILTRTRRMQGYNALWMPGTDHAGIATQTVVEKRILAEEGKRRTDFPREEFVGRIQAWKDEYEARILNQLKKMGCSCDWRRTRFTMDEICARAVRATFFKLFSDGLIYRGKRLVNWDPVTQTVLADDEVEHEEIQGHFYYLKYPLVEAAVVGGEGSGTGVPPVSGTAVPAVSAMGVPPMDEVEIDKRQGANLPHWTQAGAIYSVTFRLADSLPIEVVNNWHRQRDEILQRAKQQQRELTWVERKELQLLYVSRMDSVLNSGLGSCAMKDPKIAQIVLDALEHFDNERYLLIAWAIMPNHVHVIFRPLADHRVEDILHSWKSFTAKQANKTLGRQGQFWQDEYYDHLIRDEEDFIHGLDYVLSNPIKAQLKNWPWVGHSKAQGQDGPGTHGQDARATHGRDAHATITHVTVATTRPETMLGDTAVAMNPRDPRAKFLVGKKVRLPIVGREIPIIADEHVVLPDPNSEDAKARVSTGFLKVTPAHDPDDYAIGQRHNLPIINVMAPDGTISAKHGWTDWEQIKNEEVGEFIGIDRFEAREGIVEWFRQEGLLEKIIDYTHQVGHSYRSHVPIEPYLSDQWYVAVKRPVRPGTNDAKVLVAMESLIAEKHNAKSVDYDPSTGRYFADGKEIPVAEVGALAALAAKKIGVKDVLAFKLSLEVVPGTDIPINSLAGMALTPLLDSRLKFTPERYANNYRNWLENLRDWPISRQLWWGHQIPVWTGPKWGHTSQDDKEFGRMLTKAGGQGRLTVRSSVVDESHFGLDKATHREPQMYICLADPGDDELIKAIEARGFKRDPDVLDTWFSSALWPFSTLGWPEQNDALKTWYPGDVLCTAREIITLWVSRMVMMGQYCAGDIPFHDVFIHAMIQDGEGRKMSKSLGNGIDPLDIIDSHGADAMRFTLASMTTQTQDVRMPVEKMTLPDGRELNTSPKFDIGRNFANKLWNASRFAMMNLEKTPSWQEMLAQKELSDTWILSRLAATVRDATSSIDSYRFNELADTLYHFVWDDFCDWYLEIAKSRINAGQSGPKAVLAHCLDSILRLLHPVMPFITEAIWNNLNAIVPFRGPASEEAEPLLIRAAWPRADAAMIHTQAEREFEVMREVIRGIRNARTQHGVPPGKKVSAIVEALGPSAGIISANADLMKSQAGLSDLKLMESGAAEAAGANAASVAAGGLKVYVMDIIDRAAELTRLTKQAEVLRKGIKGIEGKLSSAGFLAKAPADLVTKERARLAGLQADLDAVERSLEALK